MTLIGEMQYLTIGDNTYSLPSGGGSITTNSTINPATAGSAVVGTSTIYNSANPPTSAAVVDYVDSRGYLTASNAVISVNGKKGNVSLFIPTKTSQLINDSGFVDNNLLNWSSTTLSQTFYPILGIDSSFSGGSGRTSLGFNFYQYYSTSGGYRRLTLGNSTSWKSTGGAYGFIQLYGTSTYYGNLVPGYLGTSTGDGHLSANRTWTLPDATGTIALTSDIPTNISSFTNDSGYITSADVPEGSSAYTGTISAVGTSASTGSNNGFARGDHVHNITKTTIDTQLGTGSGTTKFYREDGTWATPAYTTNTDENVKSTAVTSATTNYIVGSTTSTTTTGDLSKHASGVLYTTADTATSGYTQLRLGNTTATSSAGGKEGQIRLYGTNATYYLDLKPGAVSSSNKTITFPNATGTVALTSDIPADENLKWTASTTSNTYYPLVSTSTATTSTANTLNGINFYQYYSTDGGYRRLNLGNSTSWKTTGGAYGIIRLYGAAATYYGDLVPGVLGTTSGDGHISANRTWTLPDKTGTVALTSDIPTIPTVPTITLNGSSTTSPSFYAPTSAGDNGTILKSNGSGAPTWTSATLTDKQLEITTVTSGTSYYPIVGVNTTAATRQYDPTGLEYVGQTGTTGALGYATLTLGNNKASGTTGNKQGKLIIYGSTAYAHTISGAPTSNKTITLPDATGTVALTSDIPASTATPTASTIAKFDSSAHMNSTDMTTTSGGEVDSFVESLNIITEDEKTIAQAGGADASLSLTNGTMTKISLANTNLLYNNTNDVTLDTTLQGFRIKTAGLYKIQGSVYMYSTTTSVTGLGCFVRRSTNGGNYDSSTEILGAISARAGTDGYTTHTPIKMLQLSVNDILYLVARSSGGASTAYPNNGSTYLYIERV